MIRAVLTTLSLLIAISMAGNLSAHALDHCVPSEAPASATMDHAGHQHGSMHDDSATAQTDQGMTDCAMHVCATCLQSAAHDPAHYVMPIAVAARHWHSVTDGLSRPEDIYRPPSI